MPNWRRCMCLQLGLQHYSMSLLYPTCFRLPVLDHHLGPGCNLQEAEISGNVGACCVSQAHKQPADLRRLWVRVWCFKAASFCAHLWLLLAP